MLHGPLTVQLNTRTNQTLLCWIHQKAGKSWAGRPGWVLKRLSTRLLSGIVHGDMEKIAETSPFRKSMNTLEKC